MVPQCVVVCLALLATAAATAVEKCPDSDADKSTLVDLNSCKGPPCELKRGTNPNISIQFTPDEDVSDVRNMVNIVIFGVATPFDDVDGNSICDKIFTLSGEKASCPLTGGTTYTYKDSFHIQHSSPKITSQLHWELNCYAENVKNIACFGITAKFTD